MVDANRLLPLIRTIVWGSVSVLSLVVFALSAHIISVTSSARLGYYFTFTALGLATALLTLLTLPTMYLISIKRRGAFTSYLATEIGWCWFLWIMWIASAGTTVATGVNYCIGSLCSEAQVIEAFSFLNWLAMMGYTITLLVYGIMLNQRGHTNVWTGEINTFDWNAPNVKGPEHNHGVVGAYGQPDKIVAGGVVPQQHINPQGGYPQQGQYPPQNVNVGGLAATPQTTGQTFVGAPVGTMPQSPQV